MYTIKRHIAPVLEKRFKNNICLSINGARQVGKSTLCNHLFPDAKKVNFDNKIIRMAALEDEAGFLNNSGTPLFIDEAQKAPSIFEAIKDKISYDNLGYSSYVLSGSQKLKLHAGEETLAGRVSTNEINGLSLREIFDVPFDERFLPNDEYISSREKELKPYKDVWNVIHRGQYPELYENPDKEWEDFYQSYVNTYIERDVADLISAKNIMTFFKFMTSIACRTGNVLSYTSIANEVGVDAKTISEWVSILERSGIVPGVYRRFLFSHIPGRVNDDVVCEYPADGRIFRIIQTAVDKSVLFFCPLFRICVHYNDLLSVFQGLHRFGRRVRLLPQCE